MPYINWYRDTVFNAYQTLGEREIPNGLLSNVITRSYLCACLRGVVVLVGSRSCFEMIQNPMSGLAQQAASDTLRFRPQLIGLEFHEQLDLGNDSSRIVKTSFNLATTNHTSFFGVAVNNRLLEMVLNFETIWFG